MVSVLALIARDAGSTPVQVKIFFFVEANTVLLDFASLFHSKSDFLKSQLQKSVKNFSEELYSLKNCDSPNRRSQDLFRGTLLEVGVVGDPENF